MNLTHSLLILAVATGAFAQDAITLKLEGYPTPCRTTAGTSTFPLQTWSMGATLPVTGYSAGKSQISSFNVTKAMDECSTMLFGMAAAGRSAAKVTITQIAPATRQTVASVVLEGVLVSSYQVGSSASATPAESVAFTFTKITITYYGASGTTTFGWDVTIARTLP